MKLAACSAILAAASLPFAAPQDTTLVQAAQVKWEDHPFIKGAKLAVQSGDPSSGPSVLLMKFPKGMTVPPHTHTSDETVTVVSGRMVLGEGETVDLSKGTETGPGAYAFIPGKSPHWAIASEECVITVTMNKPADFHPCKQAK